MAQNKPWRGFRQDGDKEVEYFGDSADKNKISIKIDVDVSEALTGLKAVQREAKEAAKAIRDLESAINIKGEVILPRSEVDKLSEGYHAIYNNLKISPLEVKKLTNEEIADIIQSLQEKIKFE